MKDLERALGFALEAAEAGGRIAMAHFGRSVERERKADGTWVTAADWAVEAQLRLRIARAFPDHNVLGEEEGLTAAGGGAPRDGAPTWIIDPIDGTNNFMSGIPIWATLVALRIDNESVVGVCHAPALAETYSAATGTGAHCNGRTIGVDPVATLDESTVLFADPKGFEQAGLGMMFTELTRRSWRSRGFGDFWGHMLVARGAAHVMVEPELSVWDVAALQPIVREAGGRISTLDGSAWVGSGPCITTNGSLHEEVLRLATVTDGAA